MAGYSQSVDVSGLALDATVAKEATVVAGFTAGAKDATVAKQATLVKTVEMNAFWSDIDDVIDLPVGPTDTDLPNIVVSGLPAGIVLVRVEALLKVRAIENTNGGGTNAINGAQDIRIKKSTGAWGVDDVVAINLADNQWLVAASTRESGDLLIGDNDVKSEVDGNATYNLRFENAAVDLASLRLNDVSVGLRIYFTPA